jgi:SAM-dependent methyltransferase
MNDNVAAANGILRPSETEALDAWRTLVAHSRLQVERVPDRIAPTDAFATVSELFRADPHRTDDPEVDFVLSLVRPEDTWLDLGAGAGRFALPIALRCRHVTAVDPSAGMLGALRESMAVNAIENVSVLEERWPGPTEAPIADAGFIAHVGYDIADIGPFLDQLEAHSSRLCAALLFVVAPNSDFGAFWEPVYGEPRVTLPGLREFTAVLYARGRRPETRILETPPRTYKSLDHLHEAARRRIWTQPGTEADEKLRRAIEATAVEVDGGVAISAERRGLALVTWQPPAR